MNDLLRSLPARAARPASWVTGRRRHFAAVLGVVLALLVGVNLFNAFGRGIGGLTLGPAVAVALVVLSRRSGLSWHDLGLSPRTWARGALAAAVSIAAVASVYGLGVLLPWTRSAFLDVRYEVPLGHALFYVLVVIPLSTVIIEEVAFRGVLMALLTRRRGVRWGLGVSSALFGLWHILPSIDLNKVNAAVGAVVGQGVWAQVTVVAAVVAFTAGAGLLLGELRRRSGSLIASAGLHWAVNGIGVLVTALLFSVRAA